MVESASAYPKPRSLGVVTSLLGIGLLAVGVPLLTAGGSVYYAIAGLVLLTSGVQAFRGDSRGAVLYGWFLLATLLWSIYEVGFDPWALMPRLAMFAGLGLWFLLARVRRGLHQAEPTPLFRQRSDQWQR